MDPSRRLVAGRYRLLSPLGAGGMGTVWRAEDEVLGRPVAVKEVTFPPGLSDEDRDVLRERTRREARAAAKIDHPSAVTVFDVVEEDGSPFLVMELVDARTLSHVVRSDGPLTPQRTAQVGLALLGALEAAHGRGIVHRDVKPGNVLLGPEDRVVLTDFGIASSPGDSSITSTGLLLGSPSYIAPERARGEAPGPPSDLWSLGATLFTAVEGRPPYDGGDPLTTVTAVVTGDHAPFVHAGPLAEVLEGLLERDPARRLTAGPAQRALQQVAAEVPTSPLPPLPPLPRPAEDAPALDGPTGPLAARPEVERTAALDVQDVREATDAPAPPPAADRRNAPPPAAPVPAAAEGPGSPRAAAPVRDAVPWTRPQRPAPRRRSRAPLVVTALALLAAVAVIALVVVTDPVRRGGGSGSGGDRAAAPIPSAAASAPAAPAALPAGWTRYEDPAGWSIGVPPGYQRTTYRGAQVQLRDPDTRRTLRIAVDDDPPATALARARALSPQLESVLGDYTQLRLEEVDAGGQNAAELEFTYFDETELRVVDRTLVAADGRRAVGLYWQVRASAFAESLPVFEQIASTFAFG